MVSVLEQAGADAFSATTCWKKLGSLITPESEQRAELLKAGIAAHTVDALYPANFTAYAERIVQQLEKGGTEHLRAAVISSRVWDRIVAITSRLRACIGQEPTPFALDFQNQFAAFDGSEIGEYVFAELYRQHLHELANDYTHWYIAALFCTYWLHIHPELRWHVNETEADECAQWLVNSLLPPGLIG